MSEKVNSRGESLSLKQQAFLSALLAGNSIGTSAKVACVSEKTGHVWLKQPHFQSRYQSEMQSLFNERLAALRLGVSKCLATLARNMGEDAPPATQVRAAQIWLEAALDIHKMSELEMKIAELEQQIKQVGR